MRGASSHSLIPGRISRVVIAQALYLVLGRKFKFFFRACGLPLHFSQCLGQFVGRFGVEITDVPAVFEYGGCASQLV